MIDKPNLQRQFMFRYGANGLKTQLFAYINDPICRDGESDRYSLGEYMWPLTLKLEYQHSETSDIRWVCRNKHTGLETCGRHPEMAAKRMADVLYGHTLSWEQVGFKGLFYACRACGAWMNMASVPVETVSMCVPWIDHRYLNPAAMLDPVNYDATFIPTCPVCGKPLWAGAENPYNLPVSAMLTSVKHEESMSGAPVVFENPYSPAAVAEG